MAPLIAAAIPTLIKFLPDIAGIFGGDKAEDAAKDVLNIATKVTGISDTDKVLEAISTDPNVALKFQEAVMADKYRLDEIYLADRKDARDMQKEALRQEDTLSKRFIYYFASAWSIFAMIYLVGITFFTVPESAVRFADTTLGFLLATIISGIIQFFFGSSKGSKDKNEITAELLRKSKNQ